MSRLFVFCNVNTWRPVYNGAPTAVWVFSYEQAWGNTYIHESTRKHLRFVIGQISLKVSPITIEMHCP